MKYFKASKKKPEATFKVVNGVYVPKLRGGRAGKIIQPKKTYRRTKHNFTEE